MNDYETKQEAKRERYLELADKAESESASAYQRSHDATAGIPFGQPILVGHHSESRHRAALKRSDNAMRKSIDADNKAKYYRGKAAGVGKGGISSDDPEAVTKLLAKIDRATANQEAMKACNRIVKSKKLSDNDKVAKLTAEHNLSESNAWTLLKPDFCGRVGFASYQLQNNNANIRRMRQRVEELREKPTESSSRKIGDIEIVNNADENRVQIFFPGKPSDGIRQRLKQHGWRWSRYNGAWQRHISVQANYQADEIAAIAAGGDV